MEVGDTIMQDLMMVTHEQANVQTNIGTGKAK